MGIGEVFGQVYGWLHHQLTGVIAVGIVWSGAHFQSDNTEAQETKTLCPSSKLDMNKPLLTYFFNPSPKMKLSLSIDPFAVT